ncbi:acyl carrier protein [Parafrankia colletiae]|uniref:Acyl carrier protein n=1 Tax=Parafrankia colletiae TaxID=573497 RepID=A0A1S1QIS2_9ACTN|nr:phosphopantetheine-binding protein [Parafrankia colletiae]MCK9902329.1 phosphopantetheine-binding protein [Frankia sp. Cpl3]OHV33145.1 acyl carrier protein [Parafrankia colletiae]
MYDQIKHLLVSAFHVDVAEVAPEASLEDLGLDSLDIVELAWALETELRVRITDDELAELQQVSAIVQLAQERAANVV